MNSSTSLGISGPADDFLSHGLDIFALGVLDLCVVVELFPPSFVGESRFELPAVIFAEFGLKAIKPGSLKRPAFAVHERSLVPLIPFLHCQANRRDAIGLA